MSENVINIRPIELRDLASVREIQNKVIDTEDSYLSEHLKTESDIRKWYDEHQNSDLYSIFVAEIDQKFAGWVSLSNFRSIDGYDISVELSVYVSFRYYRLGVACSLVEYMLKYAKEKGFIHKVISVITSTNEASIALHKKCGFDTEGFLKEAAIKNGKYKDVVLMSKIIH